jgi:hypothetical protein
MNAKENLSRSLEVLGAYWRQGLHELGSVFYGPGTSAQHPEIGMLGTRPQSMIADGLRADGERTTSKDDPAPSILEERLQQVEREHDSREPEPPQQERD